MRHLPFILVMIFAGFLAGQDVYLSKWVPGTFDGARNLGRVEVFNPGDRPVNLSGYILSSRTYTVKFPKGTVLPAKTSLSVARRGTPSGKGRVDIDLGTTRDFLINFPTADLDGNYLMLFDKRMQIVDGVYFSPVPNVPFLPEERMFFTFSGELINYRLPSENHPSWSYITISLDPAIAFARINGAWRVTALNRNLNPATDYRNLSLRYKEGIVTVKFTTSFEEDAFYHVIERSSDLKQFEEVGRVESLGNSSEFRQYVFYDQSPVSGQKYYYRIRNQDKFGNELYSNVREIEAEDLVEEFSSEIYFGQAGGDLNVRFLSRFPTRVRVKVIDANYRDLGVIFDDFVYAETQQLLKVNEELAPGKYMVIFDTDTRRYYESFEVSR